MKMRYIRNLACLTIIVSLTFSAAAQDRLVPSVYPTIQSAIDAAGTGDTVTIADGTYTGVGNRDIDFAGKAITVRSQNGPGVCIVDCQNISNSFGFRFDSGETSAAILDGITITNCYNGITIYAAGPIIRNCNISNFRYNGAISCIDGSVLVENCKLKFAQTYIYSGGAVYFENSTATISSTDITDTWNSRGVYAVNSNLEMYNCLIARNQMYGSWDGGGGIGFYAYEPSKSLILQNCSVSNNMVHGADVYEHLMCFPPDCMMGEPGCDCFLVCDGTPADGRGGGIYFDAYMGEFLLFNCLVTQNIAESGYKYGSQCYGEAQAYGGGIYVNNNGLTSPTITNCTIAGNQAYKGSSGWGPESINCDGGGIFISFSNQPCQLTNSIVWGNTVSRDYPDPICTDYCNQVVGNVNLIAAVVQYGDWSVDPLFVQGPIGDYYLSSTAAGQSNNSPCINAGDNTSQHYGLDGLTTNTDNYPDLYQVDLGYHYPLSEQPSLTVTSPNGGEAFISTKQYLITWQSTGSVRDIRIEYSTNGGAGWTQVSPPNSGNSGSYLWTVPSLDSNQCLLKVTETSLSEITDASDGAFTIFICHLTADLTDDCKVNFDDFAKIASEWLQDGNPFE